LNQYLDALERFEQIFQAKPSSAENNEADALAESIKVYEDKHFIINRPSGERLDQMS